MNNNNNNNEYKCPSCGKYKSDYRGECPNCGYIDKKYKSSLIDDERKTS